MPLNHRNGRPLTVLDSIDLECVLFLDIETVPQAQHYSLLSDEFKELWQAKTYRYAYEGQDITPEELYFQKAGIHAEFGKIICISAGFFTSYQKNGDLNFRVKSFYGDDEHGILMEFKDLLDKHFADCNRFFLCAHNGIEFDYPYLARRMMINGMVLPSLLNVPGTKSWNNPWLLDTMELWKFGDYKERTSLSLLAACFGIPTSKDDISGKDVARVYYEDGDLERIKNYCQKDVATTAQVFRKMMGRLPVEAKDVIFLD